MLHKKVHSQVKPNRPKEKNLTKTENEILLDLCENYLTQNQIATKRKCTYRAVHLHVENLMKKGFLNKSFQKLHISDPPQGTNLHSQNNIIRLHGQIFHINILYKDERYKNKIGTIISIDNNTIKCHKDVIEVYSTNSFISDDVQKVTAKSISYFQKFITRLENDLNLILCKPRSQNIKQVSAHYARVDDELAQECELKHDKIKIYTKDDGKLWFLIDNSFSLNELETVHPQTADADMGSILHHFNDIRDNNPPTNSEIMILLKKSIKINNDTAAGLNALVTFLHHTKAAAPQTTPDKNPPGYS